MSQHIDPTTQSPEGRRVTAFLRGPIKAGQASIRYALATRECIRNGQRHLPVLDGFPIVQDNLQDDEGIQSGSSFSAGLVAPEWAYDVGQVDGHWDGYSLVSLYGESPTSFTRNLPVPIPDCEGVYRWTKQDEFAPAAGCLRIENLADHPEQLDNTYWPAGFGGARTVTPNTTDIADPEGKFTATKVVATVGGAGLGQAFNFVAGRTYIISISVYLPTPTSNFIYFVAGAANGAFNRAVSTVVAGNNAWKRGQLVYKCTTTETISWGFSSGLALETVYAWRPMIQEVTGASKLVATRYVSRHVLTSWPYHGFGVDGVVWDRTPNLNTLETNTNNVIVERAPTMQRQAMLYCPRRAGNNATTPHIAAHVATQKVKWVGRMESREAEVLGSKYRDDLGLYSTQARIISGYLFIELVDVGGYKNVAATTFFPYTPGEFIWYSAELDFSGANYVGNFSYSLNGTTWNSLGTGIVGPAKSGALFFNAAPLTLPMSSMLSEYWVDGTLVSRFDPNRFVAGGATAVMETGETWTVNTTGAGNVARIIESFTEATQKPYYHTAPETNLLATNIGAWNDQGTPASTAAVGPDGLLTAFTLTDNDTGVFEGKYVGFAVANDSLVRSVLVRVAKDVDNATLPAVGVYYNGGTYKSHYVHINTATGAASARTGQADGSHTVDDDGGWWAVRISLQNNNTGNTNFYLEVSAAAALVGAPASANPNAVRSATFAWPMAVLGARAEVYNPPGAAARVVSVLALPPAVVNDSEGFVYVHHLPDAIDATNTNRYVVVTSAGFPLLYSYNVGIYANDGTSTAGGGVQSAGVPSRSIIEWSGNTMQMRLNGVAYAGPAYDGSWGASTATYVGSTNSANPMQSGSIGPIKWGKRRPSSAFLASLNNARDADFTRAEFEDIRDTVNGTTWEYELLTELDRADGTTLEWSYKTRATAKGVSVSPQRLSVQFAQVDLIGADRTFPFLTLNVADWPNMFEADQNAPLRDGIGTLRKIKLYWITYGGGVWGYAALRKRTGHTYTILAIYREKQLVPSAEYVAATRTAPSGYDVFCVNFGSEQKDTKTGPYEILADVLVQGPGTYNSREASAELDWLLRQYGYRTVAASVAACITEDQTRGMFVDGAYSVPVAGTSLINELAQVARVRLAPTADGSIDFIQDRPTGSTFALKESATTVEVLNYDVPVPPKYVELKYRRLNDQASDFEFIASRSHSVGGSDSKTYRNRFIDDHDVAQRWISLKSKLALSLRTANIRFSAAQYFAGEVGSIDGVSCFRGARSFMLLGGSRGGDASEVRAREYDSTIYAPGSYTLPTGASNVYQPDLTFTPPAAPTGLTYVSGSSGTSISADGVGRAYMFYQVTPPSQNFVKIMFNATDGVSTFRTEAKKNGSVYEASITGLRPGVSHVIQAQAVNVNGIEGAVVSETRNSPGYATTPGAPSGVSGQQKGTKTIQYTFVPSSSPNIDYYEYSITANFGSSYGSAVRTAGTPIDYNFPTVGGTYGCRVRAVDKFGNVSAYSGTYYVGTTTTVTDTVITPSGVTNPSLATSTIQTSRLNISTTYVSTSIGAGSFYKFPLTSTLLFVPSIWSSADGDFTFCSEGTSMYHFALKNVTGASSSVSITYSKFVV